MLAQITVRKMDQNVLSQLNCKIFCRTNQLKINDTNSHKLKVDQNLIG